MKDWLDVFVFYRTRILTYFIYVIIGRYYKLLFGCYLIMLLIINIVIDNDLGYDRLIWVERHDNDKNKQTNEKNKQHKNENKITTPPWTNEQTTDQVAIIYVGYCNNDDIIAYIKLSLLQQQQCSKIDSCQDCGTFIWCCHNGPNRNGQTHSRCCRREKEKKKWGSRSEKDDIMTISCNKM